ncbi:MAG: UDP-N-acetylmuramoyl-L-alanyl-D-glutamate--2,6-diaminopimelate ligase [Planctomycetes bacterium]|nr:UDP-N-acetylmuramoyl-L-alanyl-D-glutamate--2,6-diaminopimelate ligase [Planctomycetota bacterium]
MPAAEGTGLAALLAAAGLRAEAPGGLRVTALSADSRTVRPGALFLAVPGAREDGARHAADAVARGAVAVVSERPLDLPVPVVLLPDLRAAAADLAAAFHGFPARALACAGITGTKGKTTTAFLLHAVLSRAGGPAGLLGTVEYRVGERVLPAPNTTPGPLELQALLAGMVEAGCTRAVMEVSSHALVQARTRGVPFRAAILTNLDRDHLDYHGTVEEYRAAKGLLFSSLAPGAVACLNAGDRECGWFAARVPAGVRILTYGFGPDADVGCEDPEVGPEGTSFVLRLGGARAALRSPLLGRHNIENLLAAAAGAFGLGLPADVIAPGLASLSGVPGRLERVDDGRGGFRVLVDYAHTEDSLRRVLSFLRPVTPGRLLVLGGCGGDRDRTKRPRMARAMADLADEAVFTSDNPRSEDPLAILSEMAAGIPPGAAVTILPDRREAIRALVGRARPGDTLLIAGKGHEGYQILRTGTVPFDDREEARRALREIAGDPP